MCSETSDDEIYITQLTFVIKPTRADISDRVSDGLPTDEQTLTANVEKQKATMENRFANPISEVEIQVKIGDALNRQNRKKSGLLTCSRTGEK